MTDLTVALDTLADTIGAENIVTDAETLARHVVDGMTPSLLLRPVDETGVAASLAWANAADLAVIPSGAGSAMSLGEPPRRADVFLSLERLDQILEYEPADLTVTVQAGVTLGTLQTRLAERGQWLPLDPPQGARRTLGGIVATAAAGPHRFGFGTPRDRVIGLRVAEADGMVYSGGAKVVKNVAGYDLPKLLVGSLGTLGIVTEVTLKLLPLPRVWATGVVTCPDIATAARLVARVLTSPLTPAAIGLLDAGGVSQLLMHAPGVAPAEAGAVLVMRFGGIPQAVDRQLRDLAAWAREAGAVMEALSEDAALWAAAADLPATMTSGRAARLKSAVLPTRVAEALTAGQTVGQQYMKAVAQIAYAGNGLVYTTLRGYGPDEERNGRLAEAVSALRVAIAALGGTTVIEAAPLTVKTTAGVWGPTRPDFRLMRALKDQFDAKGTLNPGRFVGGI